jgi:hypothetical protein
LKTARRIIKSDIGSIRALIDPANISNFTGLPIVINTDKDIKIKAIMK